MPEHVVNAVEIAKEIADSISEDVYGKKRVDIVTLAGSILIARELHCLTDAVKSLDATISAPE